MKYKKTPKFGAGAIYKIELSSQSKYAADYWLVIILALISLYNQLFVSSILYRVVHIDPVYFSRLVWQ